MGPRDQTILQECTTGLTQDLSSREASLIQYRYKNKYSSSVGKVLCSRSERFQVRTLALALIQKKKKTKKDRLQKKKTKKKIQKKTKKKGKKVKKN